MKKGLFLITILILLTGCAESVALLGGSVGGASSGRVLQSSLTSSISYGVKHKTGKTPIGHALAFVEENNPERKKEKCISSLEITRSEFCTIIKKQVNLKSSEIIEKSAEIVKEYPKNKIKKISKIEKIAKKSIIYNRR